MPRIGQRAACRSSQAVSPLANTLIMLATCAAAQAEFPSGLAAGDVTHRSAILWTRTDRVAPVRAELALDPEFEQVVFRTDVQSAADEDFTILIDVSDLAPWTRHYYRFSDLDHPAQITPTGTFFTAPAPETPADFRLAISGDSNFARAPFHVLNDAADMRPDLFLWFGDTAYADVPADGQGPARTLDEYRDRHEQVRTDPNIRRLLRETAIWVGWDDHEVADDYAGGDPQPGLDRTQIQDAYRAFFEYMPIRAAGQPLDPFRTYRSFRYGALAEVFLLDGRQYRYRSARSACRDDLDPFDFLGGGQNPNQECLASMSEPRAYLGAQQLTWLKNALRSSTADHKLVVTNQPMSFLGLLPYDRWDGYDAERRDILEFIDDNRIQNVWMLSTDVHANAFNPDLTSYFRLHRPDYRLDNDVIVREVIVGPIATGTLRAGSLKTAAEVLGPFADFPLVQLFLFNAFNDVAARMANLNAMPFLNPDRFAYAILDVSAEKGVTVRFRGYSPAVQGNSPPPVVTLYDSAAPPILPCGFLPGLAMLALLVPALYLFAPHHDPPKSAKTARS